MSDDRTRAMNFDHPEFIPVSVSLLPSAWIRHREALEEIVLRHPVIFGDRQPGATDFDAVPTTYAAGEHVDAWGCVWSNIHQGAESIVTGHPVPTRADVHTLQAPPPGSGFKHGFMWLILADLRGFEELMVDFAEEPPELQRLIDIVLEYNCGEIARLLERRPAIMGFGDDLGMQHGLAIGEHKWRKYMKPCYRRMYGMCHDAGAKVHMHTDGHIVPIIKDLIECGVNVLNPQVRANGLYNLQRECKGKVCVALDLDRQLFPFCTPQEIDDHVREAVQVLGDPAGGLMLVAECADDVPLENIEAICCALEQYRAYFT
jgi:uroporphyrinogen decarboxylase